MGPRAAPRLQADWLIPIATPGPPGADSLESMMAVANIMFRAAATATYEKHARIVDAACGASTGSRPMAGTQKAATALAYMLIVKVRTGPRVLMILKVKKRASAMFPKPVED